MLKLIIRRLALTLWCLLACTIFLHLVAPQAKADGPQVKITQPSVNGNAIGHPGTKVTITGSGFPAGNTLNLYTTPNGDPGKCTVNGDPAANGLISFATNPTVMVQGDSTFTVTATWPDNAATSTTAYYVCAATQGVQGLSSNTFTVAQPVAINVTPTSVAQGDQVTVNGTNWLPPQQLNVSILAGDGSAPIASNVVMSGPDGTFSTILAIPGNAGAASYAVRVYATNETSMTATQNNALTVTQSATAAPTPTVAPSPTATATTQPTETPTPSTATTGGSGSASMVTFFIYFLGGIGTLFVLIGVIVFIVYSHA